VSDDPLLGLPPCPRHWWDDLPDGWLLHEQEDEGWVLAYRGAEEGGEKAFFRFIPFEKDGKRAWRVEMGAYVNIEGKVVEARELGEEHQRLLPAGVRAWMSFDGVPWQHFLGYVGNFFDAEGKPTKEWAEEPRFTVRIIGHGPDEFPRYARALARAMKVAGERVTVRQTHRYAGDFLLDGKPLAAVPLAVAHAYLAEVAPAALDRP
jgi:hypothetical protein